MRAHILRLLFLQAWVWSLCSGVDWCYQSQMTCDSKCKGPDSWHEVHEDCMKDRQSPINIITRKTKLNKKLTPIKFNGYQAAFSGIMKNNGHSVKVSVPDLANVSEGDLRATYKAVQFHFHWGNDGGPGSEHTIDGEQYPMELHIVHMRQDFKSLDDALNDPAGVAVLGFLYEESTSANKKYDQLIQALAKVQGPNENTTVKDISLSNLIPNEENLTKYYRYNGSLTTPYCTEAVIWTLFECPIPLSGPQLKAFSSLKFQDGKPMVKTFRPVQPYNDRIVYYSGNTAVMFAFSPLLVCVCSALGLSWLY